MSLVTDAQPRAQQAYGRFKPRADLTKKSVIWAAVEGDTDGRWSTVDELKEIGVPVGTRGLEFLKYEEHIDPKTKKPHDIKYGGVTLREMVCPKELADQKTAKEAMESTEMCRLFMEAADLKNRVDATGLVTLKSEVQESVQTIQSN